jgi:uncharacterized membrane protein YccF (DUF307 family)
MSYKDPRYTTEPTDPHSRELLLEDMRSRGRPFGWAFTFTWALLVGSWATLIGTAIAWVLIVTGIGAPYGMRLLNRLPRWAFPEVPGLQFLTTIPEMVQTLESKSNEQVHPGVRIAYTIVIGWWLSLLALVLAWLVMMSLYGIPSAQRLQSRVPRLATLSRY